MLYEPNWGVNGAVEIMNIEAGDQAECFCKIAGHPRLRTLFNRCFFFDTRRRLAVVAAAHII